MNKTNNKRLTPYSQQLRRNMTREERHLWYDFLKSLPVTVNRQKTIGIYIADFYIADAKLVIELDGSQHYEMECHLRDAERDAYFNSLGLTVLRYSNADIALRFQRVCEDIWHHLQKASP